MLKNDTKVALQLKSRPQPRVQRTTLADDEHHEQPPPVVQRIEAISRIGEVEDSESPNKSAEAVPKAAKRQEGPPAWLQRRLAQLSSEQLDAKEVLKRDIDALPDESSINYQTVSVEDFGAKLLRSMGWREGMVVGRNQKVKMNPLPKQEPRPERLGLGASVDPSETRVVRGVGVVVRVNQRLAASSSTANGYGLMASPRKRDGDGSARKDGDASASPRDNQKRDSDDRLTSRHELKRSRRDDQRRERSLSPYSRSRSERSLNPYSKSRRDRTPSPQRRWGRNSDDSSSPRRESRHDWRNNRRRSPSPRPRPSSRRDRSASPRRESKRRRR